MNTAQSNVVVVFITYQQILIILLVICICICYTRQFIFFFPQMKVR